MTAAIRNYQGSAPLSLIAGGAINQNVLVKLDTTEGQVVVTTGITDVAQGCSLGKYASADIGEFQTDGVAMLTAASAISLGDQVMPDSGGGGKIATAAGATAVSVGVALQAAGGNNEVIRVRLQLPAVKGPPNT